jgi:hypothetical protein
MGRSLIGLRSREELAVLELALARVIVDCSFG